MSVSFLDETSLPFWPSVEPAELMSCVSMTEYDSFLDNSGPLPKDLSSFAVEFVILSEEIIPFASDLVPFAVDLVAL